jgi:hypothetical protein
MSSYSGVYKARRDKAAGVQPRMIVRRHGLAFIAPPFQRRTIQLVIVRRRFSTIRLRSRRRVSALQLQRLIVVGIVARVFDQ